jgi:pantoate--beta-alanine ligase
MLVFKNKTEVNQAVTKLKSEGKTLGYVPTMGALHAGHISLVKKALLENDIVIVSVFVNPTQFNDKNDLKNYPRMPEKDLSLLDNAGCNWVFMPSEDEMYPEPDTRVFDFSPVDSVMEGAYRPGHFNGVGQIVSKFFDVVQPHKAYFGQKDFQQIAVIRKMVKDLNYDIEIVACPIIRETDGLAMSSRNMLLTPENRAQAPNIYKTLCKAVDFGTSKSVSEVKKWVIDTLNSIPEFEVDYFDIVDENTLQSVDNLEVKCVKYGCIAIKTGKIRLIDNIRFNA